MQWNFHDAVPRRRDDTVQTLLTEWVGFDEGYFCLEAGILATG